MAALKERCPNCGGTIVLPDNASVGECDYCGMTFSLSELQEIRDAAIQGLRTSKKNDTKLDGNGSYESALDTSEAIKNSTDELCEKVEMALASEQWQIANAFCDEILRRNPQYAKAYLYRILANHKVFKKEELANLEKPFDDNEDYRLLIRFADVYLKTEIENYSQAVKARYQAETMENQYQALCSQMQTASSENQFYRLAKGFHDLGDYKESKRLAEEYQKKYQKEHKRAQAKVKRKKLLVKAIVVGVVLALIAVPILKKASYRGDLFSVEVTDKVNVDYDDDTVSFVFKFNIINDSVHDANYLKGYITISDAEGTVLASGSTWFQGDIASRNENYHELSLDLNRSAASVRIWNNDFSDLVIKYRITEIHFDDGTVKEYQGKDVVVNKP